MGNVKKVRATVGMLATICALVASTSTTASAQAQEGADAGALAENPFTAAEACANDHGGTWGHLRDEAGRVEKMNIKEGGTVYGQAYLMYDYGSNKNCVVTLKRKAIGKETWVLALISIPAEGTVADDGDYKYYASQVIDAAGKCVMYKGGMVNGGVRRLTELSEPGYCD